MIGDSHRKSLLFLWVLFFLAFASFYSFRKKVGSIDFAAPHARAIALAKQAGGNALKPCGEFLILKEHIDFLEGQGGFLAETRLLPYTLDALERIRLIDSNLCPDAVQFLNRTSEKYPHMKSGSASLIGSLRELPENTEAQSLGP